MRFFERKKSNLHEFQPNIYVPIQYIQQFSLDNMQNFMEISAQNEREKWDAKEAHIHTHERLDAFTQDIYSRDCWFIFGTRIITRKMSLSFGIFKGNKNRLEVLEKSHWTRGWQLVLRWFGNAFMTNFYDFNQWFYNRKIDNHFLTNLHIKAFSFNASF